MEKLSRTSKYANLRNSLENSREDTHTTKDLDKFVNTLNKIDNNNFNKLETLDENEIVYQKPSESAEQIIFENKETIENKDIDYFNTDFDFHDDFLEKFIKEVDEFNKSRGLSSISDDPDSFIDSIKKNNENAINDIPITPLEAEEESEVVLETNNSEITREIENILNHQEDTITESNTPIVPILDGLREEETQFLDPEVESVELKEIEAPKPLVEADNLEFAQNIESSETHLNNSDVEVLENIEENHDEVVEEVIDTQEIVENDVFEDNNESNAEILDEQTEEVFVEDVLVQPEFNDIEEEIIENTSELNLVEEFTEPSEEEVEVDFEKTVDELLLEHEEFSPNKEVEPVLVAEATNNDEAEFLEDESDIKHTEIVDKDALFNETLPIEIDATTKSIIIDSEEVYEESKPNTILNIVLIVLILILVAVLIVIGYWIMVVKGII